MGASQMDASSDDILDFDFYSWHDNSKWAQWARNQPVDVTLRWGQPVLSEVVCCFLPVHIRVTG